MPLPDEPAFPLKEADFLTLCDGRNGSERAGRDLHIGLFVSAAVGIVGLLSCVDWPTAFSQRRWMMIGCFLVLIVICAMSAWGWIHYTQQIGKKNTPYTRFEKTISNFFKQ